MSAYNAARYNLAPFNVQASDACWASGESKVTVGFSFAGTTNYAIGSTNVRILADSLKLDRGRIASGSASEQVSQAAEINGYFWPVAVSESVMEAELNLSQIIDTAGAAAVRTEAELNLSQIVMIGADSGLVVQATADVISLVEHICEFPGLVLRPGQVLVIDAGSYDVLLDGENAIHLQRGDWLDELNRNTQSITISATGISRVTAEILYTERYL